MVWYHYASVQQLFPKLFGRSCCTQAKVHILYVQMLTVVYMIDETVSFRDAMISGGLSPLYPCVLLIG